MPDYSYLDAVKFLISCGVDIHSGNENALRLACVYNHLETVKYLIENGSDFEIIKERTLLELSKKGNLDVIEYLVSLGFNIKLYKESMIESAVQKKIGKQLIIWFLFNKKVLEIFQYFFNYKKNDIIN